MTNNSGVTMAPMNKKHSRLGLSVLVTISHRKYGSYGEDREKVLEALWGFMQVKTEILRPQFKKKMY